jgi:hypothetical protein
MPDGDDHPDDARPNEHKSQDKRENQCARYRLVDDRPAEDDIESTKQDLPNKAAPPLRPEGVNDLECAHDDRDKPDEKCADERRDSNITQHKYAADNENAAQQHA